MFAIRNFITFFEKERSFVVNISTTELFDIFGLFVSTPVE
jgi:hypothetical protein